MLKDVFRFLAGFFRALGIYFSIGAWKWRLDQNMPDVYLFRDTELIAMLIVVGLQVIRGDLSLSLYLGGFEHDVAELALLRNRVVVSSLVPFVEGFQFGIAGMNAFEQIVFTKDRVVELDFGVSAFEFLTNFGICHRRAGGD